MTDWDDAYANAAHIPRAETYPPRWQEAAATLRESLGARAQTGLAHGEGERQVYDLFRPDGKAAGTLIFVHGGFWRAFDGSSWSHLAAGALARGWAVAMPSYDLCPAVRIRDITRQIARAVQSIAERTDGPISLTGHSAGGHLVARMLDPALIPAPVAARFHAVVPISPLSDLRPLLKTAMNDDFRMDMAEAEAESPVLMTARHPARCAVLVGAAERPAFLDQARWLSEAWGIDQIISPHRHHFDVIEALEDARSTLLRVLTG